MGGGSWLQSDYQTFTRTKGISERSSVSDIFKQSQMFQDFDPRLMKGKQRESRDFNGNPAFPFQFYLDGTGSMGFLLSYFAKKGLNDLVTYMYNEKPVENPQVLLGIIGDVHKYDTAPLQVTQFEADIRIAEQLTNLYFESRGGGNSFESYSLAYYMSAFHVNTDAFDKRSKKGMLITAGDEFPTAPLEIEHIERIFGYKPEKGYTTKELFDLASNKMNVYHIVLAEGNFARSVGSHAVVEAWAKEIGRENVILVENVEHLSEIVGGLLKMVENNSSLEEVVEKCSSESRQSVITALFNVKTEEHYW